MRRSRSAIILAGLVLSMLQPEVSRAAGPMHDRIYLLGADTDYLHWSVDQTDPELAMSRIYRACGYVPSGIPGRSKPCLAGIDVPNQARTYNIFFRPATLLDEPITWNPSNPLRFHLEGAIDTGGVPFQVQLVIEKSQVVVSPPATQVTPGVWEGSITSGGPINPGAVDGIGIRVTTQAPFANIELKTAGRSYIQLPRAFAAHSVPDLIREDQYRPDPSSYSSVSHTFTFNDRNWSASTFTGETGSPKEFEMTLDRNTAYVIAWVELYETPFFHDAARGRPADMRKLTHGASVHLFRDGQLLDHSGSGSGTAGLGAETFAVRNVAAGPLTVRVESSDALEATTGRDVQEELPFTVHVLAVGGERTVKTMRMRFLQLDSHRVGAMARCPSPMGVVPATSAVRSIALDLDWDTVTPGLPAWSVRYGQSACGEGGTGDRVRLTAAGAGIWHVGATPAHDAMFVSAHDTVFELTAQYTYSPVPPV
jgi:hypothetical protein